MQVKVYDRVPDQLVEPVNGLLAACFDHTGKSEEWLREHHDRFCNQADAFKHVIAYEGEQVVGFARAFRRAIQVQERRVLLGGLGDVCTDAAHRRSGIATAVAQAAMVALRAAGCDLAYLCAEVSHPGMLRLYGQVGFVLLNHPHTYLGRSGTRYTDTDGMLAPLASPEVFQAVLEAREAFDIGIGNW